MLKPVLSVGGVCWADFPIETEIPLDTTTMVIESYGRDILHTYQLDTQRTVRNCAAYSDKLR